MRLIHTTLRRLALAVWLAIVVAMSACHSSSEKQDGDTSENSSADKPIKGDDSMTITITNDAFEDGKSIPKKYTGDGEDCSPPLTWSGVPSGAKQLALICDDPDAPSPEPWVHWVIYHLPADLTSLPEGIPADERLEQPPGALQGANSWTSGPDPLSVAMG